MYQNLLCVYPLTYSLYYLKFYLRKRTREHTQKCNHMTNIIYKFEVETMNIGQAK